MGFYFVIKKSKDMRVFIIILWLILGVIYFWIWDKGFDSCCTGDTDGSNKIGLQDTKSKPESTKPIKKVFPLAFYWTKGEVVKGDAFIAYKDSILATLKDGKILEITGYYFNGEVADAKGGKNLGFLRAKEIRKLFPEIPEDKIRLFGKLSPGPVPDSTTLFRASKFVSAVNNQNVKEIDESAMIYFPYNSTSRLKNARIDRYLDDVAARVKKTNEKVSLIGHTDSLGSLESNYKLGMKRATVIKNILVSKGVPANKIIVSSKGEEAPLAPNDTKQNRAKNRRVELKIIK